MVAWRVCRDVLLALPPEHPARPPLRRAQHDLACATHRYEPADKGQALRAAR
jgi:hypothetical protein